VIIASDLGGAYEEKLLDILREHKEAISWIIGDIKGFSPTVHKIQLKENANHRGSHKGG
jgi:hypothetical protein